MTEKKTKKKKVMDISAPVGRGAKTEHIRTKASPRSEEKPADFLSLKKVDSRFIIGSSREEIEKINVKINKEMEGMDEKIAEFEKEEKEEFHDREEKLQNRSSGTKHVLFSVGLLAVLAGIIFVAGFILPRATVKLTLKTEEWRYDGNVLASAAISVADKDKKEIAAEVFPFRKNFNFPFAATGKKESSRKASGTITIFNEFGVSSQALVANTRFQTPDGKIFRLGSAIVVPGGKNENGKLVPGEIEATVYADKAGEEYNIGPVSKFSVPGFAGTPKYDKFYASSKEAMSGGIIGEIPYATDSDVVAAKAQARVEMEKNIGYLINSEIPADFKVLDSAKEFSVIKEAVNRETDKDGKFFVYLEAEISALAFKETDLFQMFSDLAGLELKQGKIQRSYSLEYGDAKLDLKKKEVSFKTVYSAVYVPEFDAAKIKTEILGKKESDLRAYIYTLPEIDRATVSFWPIWVKKIPKNTEKTTITVE